MKKTTLLLILCGIAVSTIGAYAVPTGKTSGTSVPDPTTTSLLVGIAGAGLFGIRRFLKK